MNDSNFTITAARRRARRRLLALGIALAAIVAAEIALAEESPAVRRLPPVADMVAAAPIMVARSGDPASEAAPDTATAVKFKVIAEPNRLTSIATAGATLARDSGVTYPEQNSFLDEFHRQRPGRPIQLLSQEEPIAESTTRFQPLRIAAAQEPVTGEPVASPSNDTASDKDSGEDSEAKKKEGERQKFGQKPVNNSLQFLRTQDVLLKPGSWQFDTGFAYTLFDDDFPAPVFDGSGNIVDVVQARVRQRLVYSPFAFRYGLTDNVQVFGVLPAGFSNTQISTIGVSQSTNSGGIGDLTAGLNLNLLDGQDEFPDVIGTFAFTAPTGDFNAPVFGVIPGSALGQGFWAISAQLLCINRYDPIIVFYGVGYRHLFEREFSGVLFAPGEQLNYQLGVGFAVNDRVTLSATFQGFYISNTLLNRTAFPGTNIEPLSLRFAATIARHERIIEPFALIGMTDSAPAASIGLTVTCY